MELVVLPLAGVFPAILREAPRHPMADRDLGTPTLRAPWHGNRWVTNICCQSGAPDPKRLGKELLETAPAPRAPRRNRTELDLGPTCSRQIWTPSVAMWVFRTRKRRICLVHAVPEVVSTGRCMCACSGLSNATRWFHVDSFSPRRCHSALLSPRAPKVDVGVFATSNSACQCRAQGSSARGGGSLVRARFIPHYTSCTTCYQRHGSRAVRISRPCFPKELHVAIATYRCAVPAGRWRPAQARGLGLQIARHLTNVRLHVNVVMLTDLPQIHSTVDLGVAIEPRRIVEKGCVQRSPRARRPHSPGWLSSHCGPCR